MISIYVVIIAGLVAGVVYILAGAMLASYSLILSGICVMALQFIYYIIYRLGDLLC